jgi:hypothetical protein
MLENSCATELGNMFNFFSKQKNTEKQSISDDTVIYSTRDYDQFKIHECNRNIIPNEILKKSMEYRNDLRFHPIDVTPDMYVIDGQHRLKYAKELNLEVFYRIRKNYNDEDMIRFNASQKNWKLCDYLNFYKNKKYKSYQMLSDLLEKFNFSLTTLLVLFGRGISLNKVFKDGGLKLRFNSFEEMENILISILKVEQCINKYEKMQLSSQYCAAISRLIQKKEFSLERFIKKIPENILKIKELRHSRCSEYIYSKLLSEIYNKKLYEKNRISIND